MPKNAFSTLDSAVIPSVTVDIPMPPGAAIPAYPAASAPVPGPSAPSSIAPAATPASDIENQE